MIAIGTRNKSLKAPPEWSTPDGHSGDCYYSFFESHHGQWAFLARERDLRVAHSGNDWKTDLIVDARWDVFLQKSLSDLSVALTKALKLTMDENERLWLAVAARSAADHFHTSDVAGTKPK